MMKNCLFKHLTWIELNSVTQSGWKIIFGHCEAVPKIVHAQMCLKLQVPEAAEQRVQTLFWPNIRPRRLKGNCNVYMREH